MENGGAKDGNADQAAKQLAILRHIEVILAVLLGITAIIGAGTAFQQSQLDGNATVALNEASQYRTAVTGYVSTASQITLADEQVFLQYEQAKHSGNQEYADFLLTHLMTPNLRETVTWWEAQTPPTSLFAEGSPYENPLTQKAREANRKADQAMEEYYAYDAKSTGFGRAASLLALSLFLFGTAAVVSRHFLRISAIVLGILVILASFIVMLATHAIEF